MINIKFAENKPDYYGLTGVHLYSKKLEDTSEDIEILINENDNAITLYKEYSPILMLLSDEIDPFPGIENENKIGTYLIFGNPKHEMSLNPIPNDMSEFQLLGYLDVDDVRMVKKFLYEKSLNKKDGIIELYNDLSNEVKEQLKMCLGNKVVDVLYPYFQNIINFFNQSVESKKVIIIISNN